MYKYQTLWIKETSLGLRYIYLPWAPGPNSPVPCNSIVEFIEHLAPSTAPPARRRLFKPRPTTHHRYNLRSISTNNTYVCMLLSIQKFNILSCVKKSITSGKD